MTCRTRSGPSSASGSDGGGIRRTRAKSNGIRAGASCSTVMRRPRRACCRPSVRQAASCLADLGSTRHRQGDAWPIALHATCCPSLHQHLSQTTLARRPKTPSRRICWPPGHTRTSSCSQRAMDQRAKRLKTEIAVDDAREAISFFRHDLCHRRLADRHRRLRRRPEPVIGQCPAEDDRGTAAPGASS